MNYPWYKKIIKSGFLQQGDLIANCPIIIPPSLQISDKADINAEVKELDVIILSQSCDLENDKISLVVVSPYLPISEFSKSLSAQGKNQKEIKRIIKDIKRGFNFGYHIIEKENDLLKECQVVDFKNVYSVDLNLLRDYCDGIENRLRLLPPYREHLAQSFARFFMRVGLPQNIEGC